MGWSLFRAAFEIKREGDTNLAAFADASQHHLPNALPMPIAIPQADPAWSRPIALRANRHLPTMLTAKPAVPNPVLKRFCPSMQTTSHPDTSYAK